jgi:DNA-directed RNA polymerase specialized sigma24 family protein
MHLQQPSTPLTCLPTPGQMPAAMVGMDDPRRRALLSDPHAHNAIRKVARRLGVSRDQLDDVVHGVVEAAIEDPRLPLDDPKKGRNYLCGIARYKAIDIARGYTRDEEIAEAVKADAEEEAPADAEDKAHARSLLEWGQKNFPRTFHWFVRHTVHEETHESIAADANVSPDHVRHTVSNIRQRMAVAMATVGLAIFALFFGVRLWRTPGGAPIDHRRHDLAGTGDGVQAPPPPTPAEQGAVLRARARRELDEGKWNECINDLDEAKWVDPAGHTVGVQDLYDQCDTKLKSLDVKPGFHPHPQR